MPIVEPNALAAALRPGQRLMGIDLGTKTIGLAVSDTRRLMATPLVTLARNRFATDAAALALLRREHDVGALVLGLPLNMDGSAGPRVQATRAFAANLLAIDDPAIVFWDERLSTAAVTRGMIAADLSRRRRAALVDRAAAAYILQGLLDRLAHIAGAANMPG
jgi:putative Holliday junction resolvase